MLQDDEYGNYKFNPDKLGFFHKQTIEKCNKSMKEGKGVIVANTNLTPSAMKPYILAAEEHGYNVIILFPKDY